MPCFGKTYCYISKTIHSVPVFRRFLLWSRDIPNMGVVRDFWRKRESNKHGKLWCSLDFRNQKKKRFWDFLSNRIVVKFIPPKPPTEPPPSFQPPQRQLTAVAPDFFVPRLLFTWKIRDSPAKSLSLVFNSQFPLNTQCTLLRKPIRMQDFIQLCISMQNAKENSLDYIN